jgi:hypothetical protein
VAAPDELAKKPATHRVQAAALVPELDPAAQAVQLRDLGPEYLPLAQLSVHATDRDVLVWYLPA